MHLLMLRNVIAVIFAFLLFTGPVSAQNGPFYYYCGYGAGLSDAYVTGIFSVSYENRYEIKPQTEAFVRDLNSSFDLHPHLKEFTGDPNCFSKRSAKEAEEARLAMLKALAGRNIAVYDTKWTPLQGIQETQPYYVPKDG
ncbi:MAG: hypothetical protein ACR2O7_01975 [Parasphingorhabdus sp.]